jgi:hypothetical protein
MTVPVQPVNPNVPKFVSGPGADKLNLYADAINAMQQGIRPAVQIFGGPGRPIVAKVTALDGTEYDWIEVELDVDGAWSEKVDGVTSDVLATAQELNLSEDVPIDSIVQIFSALGGTGETTYWFNFSAGAAMFPVKVEQTGGANGTSTTPASYTYTVRSLGAVVLGTGVVVSRPRDDGAVTVQSGSSGYGVAFYDGTALKLWDAGEKAQSATECPA